MTHDPSPHDLLNIADVISRIDADALIEDALAARTSPQDEEIGKLMKLSETNGKGGAAHLLRNLYRTGQLSTGAGE